jgi:hypothetical protein
MTRRKYSPFHWWHYIIVLDTDRRKSDRRKPGRRKLSRRKPDTSWNLERMDVSQGLFPKPQISSSAKTFSQVSKSYVKCGIQPEGLSVVTICFKATGAALEHSPTSNVHDIYLKLCYHYTSSYGHSRPQDMLLTFWQTSSVIIGLYCSPIGQKATADSESIMRCGCGHLYLNSDVIGAMTTQRITGRPL